MYIRQSSLCAATANVQTVSYNPTSDTANIDSPTKYRQKSQSFVKSKEMQANTQSHPFCTTFIFIPTHPSPPTAHLHFAKQFVYLRTKEYKIKL